MIREGYMRKSFLLLLAICLIAFVADSWGQSGQPKMVLSEQTYDAGQIYRDAGKIEHSFPVKNEGKTDLVIYDVTPG